MTYYYALALSQPNPYEYGQPVKQIEKLVILNYFLNQYQTGGLAPCSIISPEIAAILGTDISVGRGESLTSAVISCLSQCVFTSNDTASSDDSTVALNARRHIAEQFYDIGLPDERFSLSDFSSRNELSEIEASFAILELIRSGIITAVSK